MFSPGISFWMLGLYNSFTHVIDSCIAIVKRTYGALHDMFIPPTYLFFPGNEIPYQSRLINMEAQWIAKPEWSYMPETNHFIEWPFVYTESSAYLYSSSEPLPILSMEIITEEEKVLYDITDFIEKVKFYNDRFGPPPCIAHIVGAWTLSSGIVLDPDLDLKVRFINSAAESYTLSIYDDSVYAKEEPVEEVVEEVVEQMVDSVSKED